MSHCIIQQQLSSLPSLRETRRFRKGFLRAKFVRKNEVFAPASETSGRNWVSLCSQANRKCAVKDL
jgi:hypothetical protein